MLPLTFDLAKYPTGDTIRLLASLLERMTAANDLLNKQNQAASAKGYTRFHARIVPSIDIHAYLARILKYCPCANECFLSLLVYFDRMSKNAFALTGQPFSIDSYNIHRLIISGVMVASKFFSDVFYTNTRYAKVGGLPVSELNSLEIEFLKLNSFNLTVPISELQRYGDQLLKVGYIQEMRKPFRHSRSNSFDQPRHDDVDRMVDLTQRMSLDDPYSSLTKRSSSGHLRQPRRMTSTQSLKETRHEPRHSRSSVNLYQGFWKPSSPVQTEKSPSHRLSLSSIHAPPFIPSSENSYYYTPPVGIPTPPPSASPVHRHSYL